MVFLPGWLARAGASGGGIEAPPAHGFKRGLARENSVVARILCCLLPLEGRNRRLRPLRLHFVLDYISRLCQKFVSLAHRGASSRDDPEGGARRGVLRRRLVTARPGRPGKSPATHYDLAARSSLHG